MININQAKEKLGKIYAKSKFALDLILPFLILVFGVGAVLFYILGPSQYYLTSDSTDSMRWPHLAKLYSWHHRDIAS